MTWWIRSLAALLGDPGLIPSTHKADPNCSFRACGALFWFPEALAHNVHCIYTLKDTHNHRQIKIQRDLSSILLL